MCVCVCVCVCVCIRRAIAVVDVSVIDGGVVVVVLSLVVSLWLSLLVAPVFLMSSRIGG